MTEIGLFSHKKNSIKMNETVKNIIELESCLICNVIATEPAFMKSTKLQNSGAWNPGEIVNTGGHSCQRIFTYNKKTNPNNYHACINKNCRQINISRQCCDLKFCYNCWENYCRPRNWDAQLSMCANKICDIKGIDIAARKRITFGNISYILGLDEHKYYCHVSNNRSCNADDKSASPITFLENHSIPSNPSVLENHSIPSNPSVLENHSTISNRSNPSVPMVQSQEALNFRDFCDTQIPTKSPTFKKRPIDLKCNDDNDDSVFKKTKNGTAIFRTHSGTVVIDGYQNLLPEPQTLNAKPIIAAAIPTDDSLDYIAAPGDTRNTSNFDPFMLKDKSFNMKKFLLPQALATSVHCKINDICRHDNKNKRKIVTQEYIKSLRNAINYCDEIIGSSIGQKREFIRDASKTSKDPVIRQSLFYLSNSTVEEITAHICKTKHDVQNEIMLLELYFINDDHENVLMFPSQPEDNKYLFIGIKKSI